MAESVRYLCTHCSQTIEAWSDGNPFYIDKKGSKQYAYHPSPKRDRCIGNDSPHICLSCGEEFKVDSRKPITECPKCDSTNIADTCKLSGLNCPYCKIGILSVDSDYYYIS